MSGNRHGLLHFFALTSLFIASVSGGSVPKQDTVWKPYYNSSAGYCVSYPARWYEDDAFDGSGLYVMTGVKRHSRATGEIDVSVLPVTQENSPHTTTISLIEDFRMHMDGLKKFERAERLEVLDQHETQLAGSAALFTKDRYYDPQDRSTWVEEIVFVHHRNELYRIELECKADQVERFEPVFAHLVSTFGFDCGGVH